jgi:ABC-type Fe3+-hydroxamate transport system substrate-binding protein
VRRDPDVILVGPNRAATLAADRRWRTLRAVREGRVLVYDTLKVGRPGVRLGEAALHLATLLHPVPR